jgi:hypothetical protein
LLIGKDCLVDYAEVCRLASAALGELPGIAPEVTVLVWLEVFNGERRLPFSDERRQGLFQMVHDLGEAISALPEGARKERCNSLFQHHASVFYGAYDAHGLFDHAAELQRQSAETAELSGNRPGAAISYFLYWGYKLQQALADGKSARELKELFFSLEAKYVALVEAMHGTAWEGRWSQGDALVRMLKACVWLDRQHERWDEWVATFLTAVEKSGRVFELAMKLVRALDSHKKAEVGAEAALRAVAQDSQQRAEDQATAMLVLIRRELARDHLIQAQGWLAQMSEADGARHVRTVAERLLAAAQER